MVNEELDHIILTETFRDRQGTSRCTKIAFLSPVLDVVDFALRGVSDPAIADDIFHDLLRRTDEVPDALDTYDRLVPLLFCRNMKFFA